MKLARFFLLGFGLFALAFGLAYLLAPGAMMEPAGFDQLGAAATTDVRATYGGFQIGMGAFLVWASQSEDRHRAGLLLTFLSMAAVLFGRILGISLDGELNEFHRMGLLFEASLTVATFFVIRRRRALGA